MADISEATILNTIVIPSGWKNCPERPLRKPMGRNTTQVVTVEPSTLLATEAVPETALSIKPCLLVSGFISCALKQASSTTMELSTIMPTASTIEPKVITLSEYPMQPIITRADSMDIGMEVATISEALTSP